jgi:Protein of unknown function (DUF3631)
VQGKQVTTEEISAYAAVALAELGWLPDTILSRSIIVRMRRRRADEQIQPFRRRMAAAQGGAIRRLIEVWARTVPAEIDWPGMPPEIQDRDADVWEPLIAVADLVGGDWPSRVREAAKALIQVAKEAEPGLGILLLTDLRTAFGDADKLATETLLQRLTEIEEAPWGDMKGRPLDSRGLARRLREYGIRSRTVRIGVTTPRGYERSDFLDAWSRYLSPIPPGSATSATSATVADKSATVAPGTPQKPAKIGHVAYVADVALLRGRETDRCTNGVLLRNTAPIRCNLSLRRPVKPPTMNGLSCPST